MQLALRSSDFDAQALADLCVREPFDVVEDEDFPESVRELGDGALEVKRIAG